MSGNAPRRETRYASAQPVLMRCAVTTQRARAMIARRAGGQTVRKIPNTTTSASIHRQPMMVSKKTITAGTASASAIS